MKAYKGFNKDMTCRWFQYEEGKEYECDEASLCNTGFHACENPLDCYGYYEPGNSVYHEVEIEDNGERHTDDTKVVGKKIKIGAALSIADICKAHFEYVSERCIPSDSNVAGDNESASAGNSGSASAGEYGSASAGNSGSASSRGCISLGKDGIGAVRCTNPKAKGDIGSILLLAEEKDNNYDLVSWKVIQIDGEKYKANTWYTLENGKIVEVENENDD